MEVVEMVVMVVTQEMVESEVMEVMVEMLYYLVMEVLAGPEEQVEKVVMIIRYLADH